MGSANINDRSQKGDGDSEIALVVEDSDMIETRMNGRSYMAARFAATLRRKLYRGMCGCLVYLDFSHSLNPISEHLGLIEPQNCARHSGVTSFMRAAPVPNDDETVLEADALVADPLSDDTDRLWNETARTNRQVFSEIFKPVPTNVVRDWKTYSVRVKLCSAHGSSRVITASVTGLRT
jgi:phospholipase D1/2